MTEKEVIQYLKDNKDDGRGVPLGNMPEEVQEWIGRKFKPLEDILIMTHDMDWCPIDEFLNLPFALSDNYEIPQKPSGEWVEFEINEYGVFPLLDMPDTYLAWWDWGIFLKDSSANDWGFTAFGGWKYEDNGCWHMCPIFKCCPGKGDRPCIPIRIRFWKEAK